MPLGASPFGHDLREIVLSEELIRDPVRRKHCFPAVVANDAHGGDLFREGAARYRKA